MRRFSIVLTAVLAGLCGGLSCERSQTPPVAVSEPIPAKPPMPSGAHATHDERTIYDTPFNGSSRLVIKASHTGLGGSCCSTELRVSLVDRADATKQWAIDTISDQYEYDYDVTRIDESAAVLCRTDTHGSDAGCFKLFIDPAAKRLVKRVGFELQQKVSFASDAEARRLLGVSSDDLAALRNLFRATPVAAREPRALFVAHPMPQSTHRDFARARPARVADGYGPDSKLEERIGASQADRGGFWFAKAFYDGEGSSGVGGAGFLSPSGRYSFLTIPALVNWSVDAILVEPDVLWAGLVNHGEGPDRSGGLLRYDRQTHRAEIHKVPGVILQIAHVSGAVFLGTTRGLYVLRNGAVTWHHMEPDFSGSLVVITETMAK